MAKFNCIPAYTGSIGPVCIYQMYGRYFMRTRSSLTGKRVKTDPAFRKTMMYAALLAKASRIGSAVYATLPAGRKQHALYRKLTGEAMTWLKYQWKEEDIIAYLMKQYAGQDIHEPEPAVVILKASFRRKTQRIKYGRPEELPTITERKLPHALYAYRYLEKMFRRQYNKAVTTYPWTEHILS